MSASQQLEYSRRPPHGALSEAEHKQHRPDTNPEEKGHRENSPRSTRHRLNRSRNKTDAGRAQEGDAGNGRSSGESQGPERIRRTMSLLLVARTRHPIRSARAPPLLRQPTARCRTPKTHRRHSEDGSGPCHHDCTNNRQQGHRTQLPLWPRLCHPTQAERLHWEGQIARREHDSTVPTTAENSRPRRIGPSRNRALA